jgi:hypothetical protein
MTIRIRRALLLLAASTGMIAATTLPAAAGLNFSNHCESQLPR